MSLKILHLNYSDCKGGAARAAYRIHQALLNSGVDSSMAVDLAISDDHTIQGPSTQVGKALSLARPWLCKPLRSLYRSNNLVLHSPSVLPSSWPRRINSGDADVVNLHWVQSEMLSIKDIALIRKPTVWTLHDMWAFCGAEHYCEDLRWRDGYRSNNRPVNEAGFDLNRWAWNRKRKYWKHPIHLVAPSQWLANCAKASALMADWPITVIPNAIDLEVWTPIDQSLARDLLGLPQSVPIVVFGAMGGGRDLRKGFDLMLNAFDCLFNTIQGQCPELVVFGQGKPAVPIDLKFPVKFMGHLSDDLSLRCLYSAADLMLIPSRQDNLPNTGIEAHACGTPVVAFDTCGLSDIVHHHVTGYLASAFNPSDLARGIQWVLKHENPRQLRYQTRLRAESLWSCERVAGLYLNLYNEVLQ